MCIFQASSEFFCETLLESDISCHSVDGHLNQFRLQPHDMVVEPVMQLSIDQFLFHLLRSDTCDATVSDIVSPERIYVTFLFPELTIVLVVRMISVLRSDETQIMRQSRV